MKRNPCLVMLTCVAGLFLSAAVCRAAERETALPNEFFAMDTAFYSQKVRPPLQQADVAKLAEWGYAGVGPMIGGMGGWDGLPQLLKWLDEKKLKLYAIYSTAQVEPDKYTYDAGFKDRLQLLKGRDTILWVSIKSKFPRSDPAAFDMAATMVREVADLAAAQGLRVAVYPHVGNLAEHMADAVRIVEKADRKNVGVTLNLCHWLRADGPESMHAVMKLALPHLFVVSINGADQDAKDWIQPLDSGTFDVAAFLRALHQLGYTGPIGLQGFGLGNKMPPYENLARSIAAWKRLSKAAMAPASPAASQPTPSAPAADQPATAAPAAADDWKAICARLKTYTLGQNDDADLAALPRYFQHARPDELLQIEAALVAMLRDPAVSAEAKQFICRQAPFLKSDAAVAALAELQAQPPFSFMACFALQRMPNAHVAAALRGLVAQRSGRQRIDVIHTLGVLRDPEAVGLLAGELKNSEQPIATAAAAALGTIGSPQAEQALAAFAPAAAAELQPVVADARLRCAAAVPAQQALEIYTQYLKSPVPAQRMAAFVGLLARQPERRTALLLEAIQGSDAALKSVALRQARSEGGAERTAALVALLEKLPPADQAAVLNVLQERGDVSALPAVLKLAHSSEENVRRAALAALGRLGDAPQADLLIQALAGEKAETQVAARNALAVLRGPQVNDRLLELSGKGPVETRVEAIDALAARGVPSAVPLLLQTLDVPEPKIQQAAISALRVLAGAKEYPELLRRALATQSDASRQRLQDLLLALYGRSAAPQECIAQLVAALPTATAEGKALVFGVLGATGDAQALETLGKALQSSDVELQKTAVRSLAQWPDAAPVKQLMTIVSTAETPTMKVLALRTVIAIIGRDKTLANPAKAALLAALLEHSPRPDEKRLVIAALPRAACAQSLQLAVKLLADPQLANEAAAAVAGIANQKRSGIRPAEMKAALEKAEHLAKNPAVQQQIRTHLQTLRGGAQED